MAGCMGVMLRSLLVMLRRFFGHEVSLDWPGRPCVKRRDRGEFHCTQGDPSRVEGEPGR